MDEEVRLVGCVYRRHRVAVNDDADRAGFLAEVVAVTFLCQELGVDLGDELSQLRRHDALLETAWI